MRFELSVLDGPLAGKVFAFDLPEGEEVRIGRHPHCGLRLPEEYPSVSRQHCALRSVLGRVRVVINKENPVLLEGRPMRDEALVRDGAEFRLGVDGPRLKLRVHDEPADVAKTVGRVESVGDPDQMLEQQTARAAIEIRQQRQWLRVGVSVVAGMALVGVVIAVQARAATGRLSAAALEPEQKQALDDLLRVRASPVADVADAVKAAGASVYCVMAKHGSLERQVGTAWVLDKDGGVLATNAHVAEAFVQGEMFLRRASDTTVEDIAVAAVSLHPGYREFLELCEQAEASIGLVDGGRPIVACDVALMTISAADRPRLGPALRLVDAGEAHQIGVGSSCAFVGYPSEGLSFNAQRPTSHAHLGHVIALSDFFLGAVPAAEAQLLHTDLPVAGGASGSPMINEAGQVIGIMSAGSFALSQEGRRVPVGGVTYAQRIDLLEELRSSNTTKADRKAKWQACVAGLVANARKTIEQVLSDDFRRLLLEQGVAVGDIETSTRASVSLEWDGKVCIAVRDHDVDQPGNYMAYAVSDDSRDIDLVALLSSGERHKDTEADWYPAVVYSARAGDKVRYAILRSTNEPVSATIVVLRANP